jgi:hypothetical protein
MGVKYIHTQMKRCLLTDAGVRNYYLDRDDSHLNAGTQYTDNQLTAAGTEGYTVNGSFSVDMAGKYLKNVTKDFEAYIISATSSSLTLHPPMQTTETNWSTTDGATANKLIDSTATFVTDGIEVGMVAVLRDLSDWAVITAINSDTTLSVSKDIFPSGTKYSLMKGFEVGDEVQVGTALFDGSDGQVVVQIPKFWFKHIYNDPAHRWDVHHSPKPGYTLHPAFTVGGVEKDFIYISAFEGSVLGARQFSSQRLIDFDLATNSLTSLPGLTPLTNGQRSEFRQVAGNRGAGWHQWDQAAQWALQLLFMIEHETMHSQSVYMGFTDWNFSTEVDPLAFNSSLNRAIQQTGYSLRNGNNSVMSGSGGDASAVFSYRGIENFYGHLWKFVDGININDRQPYLSFNPDDYADDTPTDYLDLGITLPDVNGYIGELHNTAYGLFPKTNNGGSTTYLCDYYWQSTGWRVVLSGGTTNNIDLAGFATLRALNSSGYRTPVVGSRACFR